MSLPDADVALELPQHAAILLAAGASTRLGRAKQLVEIEGEPLLRRAARALLATTPCKLIVVLGHDAARMRAALDGLVLRTVVVANHANGLSVSLRAGIAELDLHCAGALIALTDQPALDAVHLLAVRDAWRASPAHAVASAYAGVLGVPALLPHAWFEDMAALSGDVGARELLRARAGEVVAVAAPMLERDIDLPTDLH